MSVSDTKEIFSQIEKEHDHLDYTAALELLSDLAYIVVPFDKTQREFQMLLSRMRLLLINQTGNVKMSSLIDSITRLRIDNFNQIIRDKVEQGNYSRAPQDICATLYFLAVQHLTSQSRRDVELYEAVVQDLRHMQIHGLQIESLDLILRAFAYSSDSSFRSKMKDLEGYSRIIEEVVPRLVVQATNEMNRCTLGDVITLMESVFKLWDKNVFSKSLPLKSVFATSDMYLEEYLGKSKKDVTGTQFS